MDIEKFVDQKWGGALWGPPDVPLPRYREGLIEAIKLLNRQQENILVCYADADEHSRMKKCTECEWDDDVVQFLKGLSDD